MAESYFSVQQLKRGKSRSGAVTVMAESGDGYSRVLHHARSINALLLQEWQPLDDGTTGTLRAWYGYWQTSDGEMVSCAVVQNRYYGVSVARTARGAWDSLAVKPELGVSLVAACIWLGLAEVENDLAWRYDV